MCLHTATSPVGCFFLYWFFVWFFWIYGYIVDKIYISTMLVMFPFQENSLKYFEESYRSEDLLWFNQYVELYKTKLNKIKTSWVVGFIWPFGCGKTTFMNQIKQTDKDNLRINFEAWKYPNRENLWINFVYEIAKNLWVEKTKEVLQRINGQDHNLPKAILSDLMKFARLSAFKDFLYHRGQNQLDLVYEILKELLLELCPRMDWCAYLVVEDIDHAGVYFLETLNYFLKNIKLWEGLRIIAIATIGNKEFVNNKESYLKCLDYIHYFPIQEFKSEGMIGRFLSLKQNEINYKNICDFFNYVWKKFQWYFTPRVFKHIFREVFIISQELGIKEEKDLCVLFWFVTSKYIFTKQNDIDISYFDKRIMDIWPNLDGRIKWRSFLQSFFMATLHRQPFLVEDEQWNLVPKLMVFQNIEGLRFSFKDLGWYIIAKEETQNNNNIINVRLDKRLLTI